MKKKKSYIIFLFFLIVCLVSYLTFLRPNRTRVAETFLKGFPRQKFYSKIKQKHPKWMDAQIEKDLSNLHSKKVSLYAVEQTYETIKKNIPDHSKHFVRYRIIDNKLYRYYPYDEKISTREPAFEKAIKTLTQLVKLPNVEFILSDMDGTPEFYVPDDFYITDNSAFQAPVFSRAKIKDAPYVVMIPDYYSVSYGWQKDVKSILLRNKEVPWEYKISKAFWRGGSHDKPYTLENYQSRPRVVISKLSLKYPGLIEAGINETTSMQFKDILKQENLIKSHASIYEHLDYKYLPVLDGYMCTYPGYQWRLLSNSVTFKQESNEIQWYYSALQPYEHYVPIKNDMSDLVDKVNWAKNSDATCRKISENATNFILNNLLIEDVYLYLYKVLQGYSEKLAINKNVLKNNTKNDPQWVLIQQRKKANKSLLNRKKIENKK